MDIPEQLIIEDGAYATDGGSIYIGARDLTGAKHEIMLWQHMFTQDCDLQRLPGRLYIDRALIPVRSEEERRLLLALRGTRLDILGTGSAAPRGPDVVVGRDLQEYWSKIEEGPEAAVAHLVKQLIDFVESDDYVELASRLGG